MYQYPLSTHPACAQHETAMVSLHVPQFLLTVKVTSGPALPRWQFVLHEPNGDIWLKASDEEPDASGERLELLTVVPRWRPLTSPHW